jgi:hypothetical protein
LAVILSQQDKAGKLQPIAYYYWKHSLAEYNNEIYNKEFMAIIRTFKE